MTPIRLALCASLLLACAKEPPFDMVTTPAGNQYRVVGRGTATTPSGEGLSVTYICGDETPDQLADNAEDLFEWVRPDAESAGQSTVVVFADRYTDTFWGMAKQRRSFSVTFQKSSEGPWTHSRPSNTFAK